MKLNKTLSKALLLVLGFSLAIVVAFRGYIFPDDFEYLRIYSEVLKDFNGTSEKYGVLYKSYLFLVGATGFGSVQVAFSGILILLTSMIFLHNKNGYDISLFLLIIACMPIVWFVQMRQGMALAFVCGAILNEQYRLRVLYLILALLSHVSVFIFAMWFLFLNSSKNSILLNKYFQLFVALISGFSLNYVLSNRDLIADATGLPLNILISNQALYEGNVGIGTLIIFIILLIQVFMLFRDRASHYSVALIGGVLFFISFFMPLVQRMILPFFIYLLIRISSKGRVAMPYIVFNGILFSVFMHLKILPFIY